MGLALWMTGCGMTQPSMKAEAPAKDTVAFVDVNVVPMDSERLLAHQTVVVNSVADLSRIAEQLVPA